MLWLELVYSIECGMLEGGTGRGMVSSKVVQSTASPLFFAIEADLVPNRSLVLHLGAMYF